MRKRNGEDKGEKGYDMLKHLVSGVLLPARGFDSDADHLTPPSSATEAGQVKRHGPRRPDSQPLFAGARGWHVKGGRGSLRLTSRRMPKYILSSASTITPVATTTPTPSACEIKLGLDIHQHKYVVVAQHDHATPKAPRHFAPAEFLPWVDTLLRQGHRLHLVYEACGFGFGLCRQLRERGVDCQVVAPQRLDERRTGVKTDGRDARSLCLRLESLAGGQRRRAGRDPHPHARGRTKAPGPPPARATRPPEDQTGGPGPPPARQPGAARAVALVESPRVGAARKAPARLDRRRAGHLPAAARPARRPDQGTDRDGGRPGRAGRHPRCPRESARSRPGWWPPRCATGVDSATARRSPATRACVRANTPAGTNACRATSPSTATRACGQRWWNWPGGWYASSRAIHPCISDWRSSPRGRGQREPSVRKPSWPWRVQLAVDLWRLATARCTATQLGLTC